MEASFILLLIGILSLQDSNGMPDTSLLNEASLFHYANDLVNPHTKKTEELNQTIQDYWAQYEQNIKKLDSQFENNNLGALILKSSDENNTCQSFQNVMAHSQQIVNNATVVLVEVFQKMYLATNKPPSCVTINIFAGISCAAHKAQDVRNIYKDYKDQLVANDLAAAKALELILIEFINCLKRL